MLSDQLNKSLAPFRVLASRSALAPAYRAIELSPNRVKACSSYGLLEANMQIGITKTVYVDAVAFLSVVQSLPSNADMQLTTKDNILQWSCGTAGGKLALITVADTPNIPPPLGARRVQETSKALATAMECGGVSCDNGALGAIGIYGVVIYNQDNLTVCSTDNTTVSSYTMDNPIEGAPAVSTLPPLGAELLASIMNDQGDLEFDGNGIVYRDPIMSCMVRQVPALKTNISDILNQFNSNDMMVGVPKDRISKFIKRVNALTESRRQAKVILGGADGCITLSFAEGVAESDEYILADDLGGFPDIEPVALPANKVARALEYIDSVVLDYIDRGVIIFQGGPFRYLISGTVAR